MKPMNRRGSRRALSPWFTCALILGSCAGAAPKDGPNGSGGRRTQSCVDLDGDGYGAGCSKGWDCDDHDANRNTDCGPAGPNVDWVPGDAGVGAPDRYVPPATETPTCPTGTRRIHVKDLWSAAVDPTLGTLTEPPLAVVIKDVTHNWMDHNARKDAAGCEWYSDCLPEDSTSVSIAPIDPTTGCVMNPSSGAIAIPKGTDELTIDYDGTSTALKADYPNGKLRVTTVTAPPCPAGLPDTTTPPNFTKVHVRWPWGNPDQTGFPGTGCESKKGITTPPYPTSLAVNAGNGVCVQPMLEFQDGHCPWYTVLIPNSKWVAGASFMVAYPDFSGLQSPNLTLPERTADEYWVAYNGPLDIRVGNATVQGTECLNWSVRPDQYRWYTSNPGPGYAGCGGSGDVKIDPCNPPAPTDFSIIHFRYIWAGQKTFTFFPKPGFMPFYMGFEVGGESITCWREADRPWFNCQVPNKYFTSAYSWRAYDKVHPEEWNTVDPRPMPTKPGEYWLRWYYGKPDIARKGQADGQIPSETEVPQFKFFDYYPDATNGDWSATSDWGDQDCAAKPPATPITIGYKNAWFPYDETNFAYPFGVSLARTYGRAAEVQDLFNALVWERYQIWKQVRVRYDADACGAGTARVRSDPPETVSEGQGYGIAISAAIGDKELFTKLWNFTRHFLSQKSQKYCGGLMGWMWSGPGDCRPLDHPCDVDKGENCGGNNDSAFDGDIDIAIGLVYAARQWPEFMGAAVGWLIKMECEIDSVAEPPWRFPTPGDTFNNTNCSGYPGSPCTYVPGANGRVNMGYYGPGYFRVFGDFLAAYSEGDQAEREKHRDFWYKTAESYYELVERCYDQTGVNPGLFTDWGQYQAPCASNSDNYNWARGLWRVAVDAAWFGDRTTLPENAPGSSRHYTSKTRIQAKIDNIQHYYTNFYVKNPPEPNANRFSTLCRNVTPDGAAAGCDPAYDHNSYFVNTAMCSYVTMFDNDGETTPDIRREAIEESISATLENFQYYQESIGVYTLMFLTGNFPNPMVPPGP